VRSYPLDRVVCAIILITAANFAPPTYYLIHPLLGLMNKLDDHIMNQLELTNLF